MSIKKVQQKQGHKWLARTRNAKGKQIKKVFDRKIDAEAWEREQINLCHQAQEPALETAKEMDFAQLIDGYQKRHLEGKSGSTQQRYEDMLRLHLSPFFGEKKLQDITVKAVDEWFWNLREETKLGPKTLNMALSILKSIFNWAIKRQFMLHNPATPIELLKVERPEFTFWSADEIESFLHFHKHWHFRLICLVAINTGMRLNELVGLKWDMVDLDRGMIRVLRTWCNKEKKLKNTTKGKKPRSVPINVTLRSELAAQKLRVDGPWVFPQTEGQSINSQHFTQSTFRPACREAGVPEIRFHDLRHTYASHFIMNGGDLFRLQKILGHSSIQMTERYAHLSPDYLQGAGEFVEFGAPKEGDVIDLAGYKKAQS